eukprot:6182370-Pleurochrysis_carterae.AAC.1
MSDNFIDDLCGLMQRANYRLFSQARGAGARALLRKGRRLRARAPNADARRSCTPSHCAVCTVRPSRRTGG